MNHDNTCILRTPKHEIAWYLKNNIVIFKNVPHDLDKSSTRKVVKIKYVGRYISTMKNLFDVCF